MCLSAVLLRRAIVNLEQNIHSFEDAKVFLQQLNDFYTAGWMKIMGQ